MTIDINQKVAVVTGSSSWIGLETSVTLSRNRFLTYATVRNLEKSSKDSSRQRKQHQTVAKSYTINVLI
ncbi:MAG TPA: hypothetical protein VIP70_09345 [Nitrososphaeraceae archaeon]